ncbi:hypothetical protein ABZ568_35035 [Streptomyces olindensis]|uniref:Uncharacterized protein n=1 Tax=Streptomyces olindensis TaxID=358823 RepID=A0ABV2Y5K4_9ACTN
MHKLPYALLTALDVTASQCIAGGGMIIISAVGNGSESYTKRCKGGIHDGQTVL